MGASSRSRTSNRSLSDGGRPFGIRVFDETAEEPAFQQTADPLVGAEKERCRRESMASTIGCRDVDSSVTADSDHNELMSYADRIIQLVDNSRKREREHVMLRRKVEQDAEVFCTRISGALSDLRDHIEAELDMRRELELQLLVVRDQLTRLETGGGGDRCRKLQADDRKDFLEQEHAKERCELEQELSILRHHNTELIREGEAMRIELEDKKAAISILEELYVKTLSILHFISAKRERERDAARKELEEQKKLHSEALTLSSKLRIEGDAVRSELEDTQKAFLLVCERNKRLKVTRDSAASEVQVQKEALAIAQERNSKLSSDYDAVIRELQLERLQVRKLVSKRDSLKRELDEQREKNLCQICLENPRDTIALPCVHLHYCFACLQEHHVRSKTCPTCRSPTSGILQCTVSME